MSGFKLFGLKSYSPARQKANLLRLKIKSDAAWSVGYERGFGPNPECIVPSRYFEVKSFFIAGWNAGQKDYKKEKGN